MTIYSTLTPNGKRKRIVGFSGYARNDYTPVGTHTQRTIAVANEVFTITPPVNAVGVFLSFTGNWRYIIDGVTNAGNNLGIAGAQGAVIPITPGSQITLSSSSVGNTVGIQFYGTT